MQDAARAAKASGSTIERIGVRFLRARAAADKTVADDALHVLNERERRELRAVERAAIARAAAAGALSGLACALPVILLPAPATGASVRERAAYWAVIVGVTVVASVAEIAFLYWDGLRAVHQLAHAAGMDLSDPALEENKTSALWALARAALEAPNPPDAVPGVDPMREASKLRVFAASALYKLKVTISGFLAKALIRRALGRAATRTVLELVAVPVTALWDAAVCWLIVREARLRVIGPSAAQEFTAIILREGAPLSDACKQCCLRAVGAAAVRSEDLHPNMVALLEALQRRSGMELADSVDDSARFLAEISALSRDEQTVALRALAAASIIDGRLAREERRLLAEAFARCDRALDLEAIDALRVAFVSGDAIPVERVLAVG